MAIRIDGPGPTTGVQGGQPTRRAEGTGAAFRLPTGDPAPRVAAAAIGGATALTDVASLLALQSVPDPEDTRERKRRAVKRGHELLDVLESVKLDLLGGAMPTDRLERLVQILGQRRPSGDDQLDGLVADIELRARVELAKFGRFPD